jgi:hypothetical protein
MPLGTLPLYADLPPGYFFLRHTGDREAAVRLYDVFRRRFDEMSGDAPGLVDDPPCGDGQRAAADHGAAAAEGAGALLRNESVAVQNRHPVHGRPHQLGCDLRPYCLVPLAMGARAGEHGDVAVALHPHRAALESRAAAGLDECRETNADDLAAGASFVAPAHEILIIGNP